VAKALQVRSRNPAGCDKIAHESKPLRSAAPADAVHLAIDRPVFLFDRGIAVCLRTGDICASRRQARGTGRDVPAQLVPGGGDASFEELPAAAGIVDGIVRAADIGRAGGARGPTAPHAAD